MDPDEPTTRRGWLSALARTARSRAREASDALGPGGLDGLVNQLDPLRRDADDAAWDGPVEAASWADPARTPARTPARAPDRAVSPDEVIALAHEEGFAGRDDALRSLALSSWRMTPVVPRCADGWIRTSDDWADVPGSEVLLAQIKLSATADRLSGLPGDGWLVLFAGAHDAQAEDDAGGLDVVHAHGVLLDSPADVVAGVEPVGLAPETVLPQPWHEAVQAIDFDGAELAAYVRLRARVQDLQGVERDDDGGADVAYHRLLGWADGTSGTMAAECDASGSGAGDWRLLAQISVGSWRRAYVWIRDSELQDGSFDDLRAFVR